jgi:hypothetical protein
MATRLSDVLKWEESKEYSREAVTVLSGQTLLRGHVVGKVAAGAITPTAGAGNTGDGSIGTVTAGVGVKEGSYVVTIIAAATDAGEFAVTDPDGDVIGIGNVAVAFVGPINFTLADGAADFIVGDFITVAVAAGSAKVKEYDPANVDGSDVVAGILYDAVDASAADVDGTLIVRDAIVSKEGLAWFSGVTAGQKTAAYAALAALGIIAKESA